MDGSKLKPALRLIAGAAIVLALITTGLYFSQFNGAPLSTNPDRWGVFGDYLGGVLNPVFSFFALIALLYTIALQSEELRASREELALTREELARSAEALRESKEIAAQQAEHFETQAKKEDVYRMITAVFGEAMQLFGVKKHVLSFSHPQHNFIQTEAYLYELFGHPKDASRYERLLAAEPGGKDRNSVAMSNFLILIYELHLYLVLFDKLSGDTTVTSYYRRRLDVISIDLHAKGFLDEPVMREFNRA